VRRLRPGELDALVLEFVNADENDTPLGVAAVAKALGRSAGAVGNCLARLATAGKLEQVSEHPRRYSATPPKKRRSARRSRKDKS
jgi:nitric oxide reductase NorQ protein